MLRLVLLTFVLPGVSANAYMEDKIKKPHPSASQPRDSKGQFGKKPTTSSAASDVSEEARLLTSRAISRITYGSRPSSRASSRASSLASIPEKSDTSKIPASSPASSAEQLELSVDDSPKDPSEPEQAHDLLDQWLEEDDASEPPAQPAPPAPQPINSDPLAASLNPSEFAANPHQAERGGNR